MVDEETQGVLDDDFPDGVAARLRPAADRFAGLPIAQAALRFASARHAKQYREIDDAPFIIHPVEVGRLLHRDGRPDEVIAAGLLHDTLEKTATTCAELQHRFGTRVARLVASVSDDPSIGDRDSRKRELRDSVAHAEPDALAIFAADKISKVRELALLPPSRLHETATRAKLAHYRASLKMLRQVTPDGALVNRLDAELSRLLTRTGRATTTAAPSKRATINEAAQAAEPKHEPHREAATWRARCQHHAQQQPQGSQVRTTDPVVRQPQQRQQRRIVQKMFKGG